MFMFLDFVSNPSLLFLPPTSPAPYLPLPLQRLQLSLVGLLSQSLIDFGHDRNFLTPVTDGRVVFGLWQISHEPQHCDPHRQSSLGRDREKKCVSVCHVKCSGIFGLLNLNMNQPLWNSCGPTHWLSLLFVYELFRLLWGQRSK